MAIKLKWIHLAGWAFAFVISGMVIATNVSAQSDDEALEGIMEGLMEDIDRDIQRDITQDATQETQESVQEDAVIPEVVNTGVGDQTTIPPASSGDECSQFPSPLPADFPISGETFQRCFGN